jgi:transcriptional antiterminator RfaH
LLWASADFHILQATPEDISGATCGSLSCKQATLEDISGATCGSLPWNWICERGDVMSNQIVNNDHLWYVLHTHPKQEDRAACNLRVLGVQILAPKIKERRYNEFASAPTYLTKPLFPSYIFARFKVEDLYHKIRFTRGVRDLVSFNGAPVPVDETAISIIQSRVKADGFVGMNEDPAPGDNVIIKAGPFKDFCGIFEREMKDADRVRILLNTVNYQAHVEIGKSLVAKVC